MIQEKMTMNKTIRAYERYSGEAIRTWGRGRRRGGKIGGPFMRHVVACLKKDGGSAVLDIGCGPGFDALGFARSGMSVLGVERVPAFLRYARGLARNAERPGKIRRGKVHFLSGDLRRIHEWRSRVLFDLIWANASLIHLKKKELPTALRRLKRFLRPGGFFAGTFFHGKGEGIYAGSYVPGRFFARYLKPELQNVFSRAGWTVKSIRTVSNEDRKGRWVNVIANIS